MTTLDRSSHPSPSSLPPSPSGGAGARSLGWRGVAAVSLGSVLLGGAGAALLGVLSSGGSSGFGGPGGGPGGFRGGFGGTPPGLTQQVQPGRTPQGSGGSGATSGTTSGAPIGGPRRALHGVTVVGLVPRESVRGRASSTPAASI